MEMKAITSSLINKSEDQASSAIAPMTSALRNVSDPSSEVLEAAELLEEILAKLPAKTVFGFTTVSRYWNKVITDPKLVCRLKVPRNPTAVFVKRLVLRDDYDIVQFTRISLQGVATRRSGAKVRTTVSLNFLQNENLTHDPFVIEHSGHGLMICSSRKTKCYFLYNPTTKKRVRIPELETSRVISMQISFQAPGTYKIVAVSCSQNSHKLQLHVLEPKESLPHWRNTGVDFPVFILGVNFGYGVDMDGVIYWPCFNSSSLVFFNAREETLHWLPEVPQPYDYFLGIAYFGECKGNLCLVANASMRRATFDMLELKTDHSMWFIRYHIDLTPRVIRANSMWVNLPTLLALLPGEEAEDDSYLIIYIHKEVVSYNLKDGTTRKLCDLSFRPSEYHEMRREPWKYVHPYLQNPIYPRLTAS